MAAGKKSGRKSQASNDFLEPLAPTLEQEEPSIMEQFL
jgi:hypothetical protein